MNCMRDGCSLVKIVNIKKAKSFGEFSNFGENHYSAIQMVMPVLYSPGGFGGNFWRWAAPETVLPWGDFSLWNSSCLKIPAESELRLIVKS